MRASGDEEEDLPGLRRFGGRLWAAPRFLDPTRTRRAGLLHRCLWTSIITSLALVGVGFVQPNADPMSIGVIYGSLLSSFAVSLFLLAQGRIFGSALLFNASMWLAVNGAMWFFGGVDSQSGSAFIVAVLIAGLTLGGRWGIAIAIATALSTAFIVHAENAGFLPSPIAELGSFDGWISLSGSLTVAAVMVHFAIESLGEAAARAQRNQAAYRRSLERLEASQVTLEERAKQSAAVGQLGQQMLEPRGIPSLSRLSARVVSDILDEPAVMILCAHRDSTFEVVVPFPAEGSPEEGSMLGLPKAMERALEADDSHFTVGSSLVRGWLGPAVPHNALVAPIPGCHGLHGLIVVASAEPWTLRDDERVFVATVAGVLSAAMDRQQADERARQSQRMEAVGQLAGGIAHDFNNLLTAILACSQLLVRRLENGDPTSRRLAHDVHHSGERAALLTQQLLSLSRRQIASPETLDLGEAFRGIEAVLRRVIGEHIELGLVVRSPVPPIRADRSQLEQVLLNLCVNARDAMPDGGRLRIEVAGEVVRGAEAESRISSEMAVVLRVSDSGEGIPAEIRQRIFEPFFTTKEEERGTGLGLATVQGIVRNLGGSIQVDSEVGEGSTFTVWFPAQASGELFLPTEDEEDGDYQGTGLILVVEDDPLVQSAASEVLVAAGYRVTLASNGAQALERFEAGEEPDLVLTDLRMPRMGGRELARELRRRRYRGPVLFMTGYAMDEEALSNRARRNLVRKPFRAAALARRVRDALAEARRSVASLA